MVLITIAILAAYGVLLPFISLYVFKQYDTYHYNQLAGYYNYYAHGYSLPSGQQQAIAQKSVVFGQAEWLRAWACRLATVLQRVLKRSILSPLYERVIRDEHLQRWVQLLKIQATPFYLSHVQPLETSAHKALVDLYLTIRPYWVATVTFVAPRFELVKNSYIGYYHQAHDLSVSYYHQAFLYLQPYYSQYVQPEINRAVKWYYVHGHPFYLQHEDKFVQVGDSIVCFIVGVILFKLFEKPISKVTRLVLSDVHDVGQGLSQKYQTELPKGINSGSLIDDLPDSEKAPLLKAVRAIDSMRPLDPIVNHEKDFTGIVDSSSSSSVGSDSTTKVEIPARHPYNQPKVKSESAATAAQKAFQKAKKSKQQENLKISSQRPFLAESLAVEKLDLDGQHVPHVGVQVQVQRISENYRVEIEEQIEDEKMAGKGAPYTEMSDEEEEEEEEEEDSEDSGELTQNTEERIRRKINSLSDTSSDLDEKKEANVPRIITDLNTPQKYNTGIFYSTSKHGLITAAIPLTPSPTKPLFGVVGRPGSPLKSYEPSPTRASLHDMEVSFMTVSSSGRSVLTNPSPAKPVTGIVSEETVYATSTDADVLEIRRKQSHHAIGELVASRNASVKSLK